jgi:hypothetical protein
MPSFTSLALFSLAALGAVAAPAERRQALGPESKCMTDAEADQVATAWGTLIASYNDALADSVLTENFTDYSESVNTLINSCPQGDAAKPLDLLAPSFTSREMFKIGQGQQPAINFNRLNIWPGCTSVNIRWMTTNTAPIPNPKPVVGLIAMEVVKNQQAGAEYPWLISTVYSEFDAGAWLQNLVEAGICSSGAGLPSTGNGTETCSTPPATNGTVVVPPPATNGTVVSPVSSTVTVVPTATYPSAPEETDDCDEEDAAPTAY